MSDWRTLVAPSGDAQPAAAEAAPSRQGLGTPAPPQPEVPENLSADEKLDRTMANSGRLGKIAAATGAFASQFDRALTMGNRDKLSALSEATIHSAARGINSLYDSIGAQKPFPESEIDQNDITKDTWDDPNNFSNVYHDTLAKERGASERYSEGYPYRSFAAKALGIGASIPLAGETRLFGGVPGVGTTLGAKVGYGTKTGMTLGAAGGFGNANDESLTKDLLATGIGSAVGGTLGAGATALGEKIVAPVANWVAGKFGADAVENAATRQILDRISSGKEGGGPTAQDMLELVSANHGKPLMLADIGGEAVTGLGERIANSPGAGRQVAVSELNARDSGAGVRLGQDLADTFGGAKSNYRMAGDLSDIQKTTAAPLYERAFNYRPTGAPGEGTPLSDKLKAIVADPIMQQGFKHGLEIQRIEALTNGQPFDPMLYGLKGITAEGEPIMAEGATVPNMRLLDAGKRGLDALIGAEETAPGQFTERGRALIGLKKAYVGELRNANPIYGDALDAWSGPAASRRAIAMGEHAMISGKIHPDQIADQIASLSPGDQELYRLGGMNALKTQIGNATPGANEALKIMGTDNVKNRIAALAGSQDKAEKLITAANLENLMAGTKQTVLGNSRTPLRVGEQAAANPEVGISGPLVQTVAGAMSGEPVVSGMGAYRLGEKIFQAMHRPSPAVDTATARMIFNPNAEANQTALARIMAMGARPSLTPSLTRPFVQTGSQLLPGAMNYPLLNRGDGR